MSNSIFEGLGIKEEDFYLENGKSIKLIALPLFDMLEFSQMMSTLSKDDSKARIDAFITVIKKCAVNENYEPFLSDKDINMLKLANGGNLVVEIFNRIMALTGFDEKTVEEAKKKSEIPT